MPLYEYTCQKCHAKFEKLVRTMSDGEHEKVECPECKSTRTARSISVFAAVSGSAGAKSSAGHAPPPGGGCGRCGGPGPCAFD